MSPLLLVSVTLILMLFVEHSRLLPALAIHVATLRDLRPAASSRLIDDLLVAMADASRQERADALGRYGGRDPIRHHRAIVGRDARTPWYARVRAVILLLLIVAGFGAALAGITLVLVASGRILLEILAG